MIVQEIPFALISLFLVQIKLQFFRILEKSEVDLAMKTYVEPLKDDAKQSLFEFIDDPTKLTMKQCYITELQLYKPRLLKKTTQQLNTSFIILDFTPTILKHSLQI